MIFKKCHYLFKISSLVCGLLISSQLIAGPITSGGEDPKELAKQVFKTDSAVSLAKESLSRIGWVWTYTSSEGEELEFPVDAVQISAECRTGIIPEGEFPCSHRILVVQIGSVVMNSKKKFDTIKAVVSIGFDGAVATELSDITPY